MAIAPISVGDTNARAKMNEAIAKANLVDAKAGLADLASEATVRQAAIAQEAAARRADILALPLPMPVQRRPGDAPLEFGRSLADGEAVGIAPLPDTLLRYDEAGKVIRLTGEDMVAPRHLFALEPGRRYLATFAVQRRVNSPDPDNDAIRCAFAWYGQGKGRLLSTPQTVARDLLGLTTGSGRQVVRAVVSRAAGANVDIVAPAGARYVRPYVQTFGTLVQNDVEVIDWADITDVVAFAPDVSALEGRMAAVEGLALGDRVLELESQVIAPNEFRVATIGDLEAANVPVSVDSVVVLGFYGPRGGAARYRAMPAGAPHHGSRQSADGRWWELSERRPDVMMFGAKADNSSDDGPSFTKFIEYLQITGLEGYIPAGNYRIATVINPTVTSDIELVFAAGARLVADANLNNRMFFLSKITGNDVSLRVSGGFFDGSAQPNGNGLGTSAWDIFYVGEFFDVVHFHDIEIFNGEDYTVAGSDSGIFAACKRFRCTHSRFQGCWDSAIYLSADNTESNGEDAIVQGCSFVKCTVGVISKRAFRRYIVVSNFFDRNGAAVATGESGALLPGAQNIIANNQIVQPRDGGILVRVSDGTIIANNRIEDPGYTLAGTASGASSGIALQGSSNCVVEGNWIGMRKFARGTSTHRAIQLEPRTVNGTTYNSTRNLVASNQVFNMNTGVREDNSSQDFNRIIFNLIVDAVTQVSKQGANSTYIEFDSQASSRMVMDTLLCLGGPFGAESLRVSRNTTGAEDFVVVSAATGAPTIGTVGGSADIDLRFPLKGTGKMRFGTFTAFAGAPVTGYVEIKDAGGTLRKLAVVA